MAPQRHSELDAIASPNLLTQVAAFVSVVSAGSFTAAARRSNTDKTVLSRRVQALETALQVRLLNRTTRKLHVTQAGQQLFEQVYHPLTEVAVALESVTRSDQVRGLVRIATVPALGPSLWGPVILELRRAHPELELEIRATETMVNLVDHGFDLAIRVGTMPDSSLIAQRLCTWRHLLVASPAWVEAHPEVRSPADLARHWVLYDDVPLAHQWRFERGEEGLEVSVESAMRTDNSEILIGAVTAGLGVTATSPFLLEHWLESGKLVRVLPEWRVVHQHGIYAITPHRAHTPARVELVREVVRNHLTPLAHRWRALTD